MPALTGRVKPRDTNLVSLIARCSHLAADPQLRPLVDALFAFARDQDDFNKDKWAEHQGQPAAHARTHMGGEDTVISTAVPLADTIAGDAGSPRLGATAHGHRHRSTLTTNYDLLTVIAGVLSRLPFSTTDGEVLSRVSGALAWASPLALNVPLWVKYTVSHAALQAAALTNDIELFSLPAKGAIHAVTIKHSVAFGGTGITGYTLSLGIAGDLTRYASAFDVFQAVGPTVFQTGSVHSVENFGAATSIRLAAVSAGANLNQSTSGSVEVYVLRSLQP